MNHVSGPVYLDFCAHRSRIGGRWAGSFYIYRAFSSNVHPALYFAAFQLRLRSILRYLQTGVPDPETAGFPEYRARALFHIREYHDRFIFGRVAASRFFLLQVLRNSRGGSDALRRLARC
jgi:hypothetical protein